MDNTLLSQQINRSNLLKGILIALLLVLIVMVGAGGYMIMNKMNTLALEYNALVVRYGETLENLNLLFANLSENDIQSYSQAMSDVASLLQKLQSILTIFG